MAVMKRESLDCPKGFSSGEPDGIESIGAGEKKKLSFREWDGTKRFLKALNEVAKIQKGTARACGLDGKARALGKALNLTEGQSHFARFFEMVVPARAIDIDAALSARHVSRRRG